jgi:hypothetical protein
MHAKCEQFDIFCGNLILAYYYLTKIKYLKVFELAVKLH